eukprot:SAG22_NODE_964_length_6277_cov_12.416316_4_plen_139_part_00
MVRNVPTVGPKKFSDVINDGPLRFFVEAWPTGSEVGAAAAGTPKKSKKGGDGSSGAGPGPVASQDSPSVYSVVLWHRDGEACCWLDDLNVEYDDRGGLSAVPSMEPRPPLSSRPALLGEAGPPAGGASPTEAEPALER